jgi:putative addiction module component (TIGR02574 family)
MGDRARRLLEEALALPLEERAVLVLELEASLHEAYEPPEQVEAAWREEIARRLQEIEAGTAELFDGETVLRELRARYPRRG